MALLARLLLPSVLPGSACACHVVSLLAWHVVRRPGGNHPDSLASLASVLGLRYSALSQLLLHYLLPEGLLGCPTSHCYRLELLGAAAPELSSHCSVHRRRELLGLCCATSRRVRRYLELGREEKGVVVRLELFIDVTLGALDAVLHPGVDDRVTAHVAALLVRVGR